MEGPEGAHELHIGAAIKPCDKPNGKQHGRRRREWQNSGFRLSTAVGWPIREELSNQVES